MAIFGNNSLRPEEKIGGFESGVFDTGIFSLNKMEEYPGILPNFEYEDKSVTSIIFEKEGKDFVYQPKKLELTPQDLVKPIIGINPDEIESEPEGESFFRQSKKETDDDELLSYGGNFDDDTFDEKYGGEKYVFSKEENLDNRFNFNKNVIENDYADSDLKNILEDSIGRNAPKKGKPTLDDLKYDDVSDQDSDENQIGQDNDALDELQNGTMDAFFDFSSINADKPSQFDLEGEEKKTIEEEVQEKKKRKKTPLWLFSLYIFAGVLVLGAILGLVFWKVINKKFNFDGKQDSSKLEKVISPVKNQKVKDNQDTESRHTELIAENDDVKVEMKVEIKPEKQNNENQLDKNSKNNNIANVNNNDNNHNTNSDKNHTTEKGKDDKIVLHSNDDKTKIESKITIKDKSEKPKSTENKLNNSIKSNNHSDDNSHKNESHKDKSHKDLAHNNESHKVTSNIPKKDNNLEYNIKKIEEKKAEGTKETKTDKLEKIEKTEKTYKNSKADNSDKSTKAKDLANVNNLDNKIKSETFIDVEKNESIEEDKPEYSVQIYSTLSKSDAQDMLKKLTSYGINSGFIITQNIRDEVWYRVRYGKFNSKEDAKNNASKYGFNQIWIDRVK